MERSKLSDLAGGLLYFASNEQVRIDASDPFVADSVPEDLISSSVDDGFFYRRDASGNELVEWAKRNADLLASKHLTAAPLDSKVWFVDDVRYNIVRAEFGFSEREGRKIWRKSLAQLKRATLAKLIRELEQALVSMKFPENVPSFEMRSVEWLEKNEKAMLVLAGR